MSEKESDNITDAEWDPEITREKFLIKSEVADELRILKRGSIERWFDKHNHKMEFLRTFFGFVTLSLQLVILAKLFNLF